MSYKKGKAIETFKIEIIQRYAMHILQNTLIYMLMYIPLVKKVVT